MAITLNIPRQFKGAVDSLTAAQIKYCELREASGMGASEFAFGKVVDANGKTYRISYNGRLWDGETLIAEAPPYTAYANA